MSMTDSIIQHKYDLPDNLNLSGDIAVDTETMGLMYSRDRLCLVQLCDADGAVHVVHYPEPKYNSPNLMKLLEDKSKTKIFHYARFDIGVVKHYLNANVSPVYCTKIASRLVRTYTDRHGLKELCKELLAVDLSKQQQSSYWGNDILTPEQLTYAASDVIHLHKLRDKLNIMLEREKRTDIAKACFEFLPSRSCLDLIGWNDVDIFAHS